MTREIKYRAWYAIEEDGVTRTNREDNARLIADAPLLLDEVRRLREALERITRLPVVYDEGGNKIPTHELEKKKQIAQTALNQAKGGE